MSLLAERARTNWRSLAQLEWRPIAQLGLAAWFAFWAWATIDTYFTAFPKHLDALGLDARIYLHAAQTWLGGGDPWTAYAARYPFTERWYFAGPPPTVFAFVPFAWLGDVAFTLGWEALTIASAFYILRRLQLPVWWILFPPLMQGMFVGNPHVVCMALILTKSSWLQSLATPLKAYAVLPMIGERQWRALAILAVAVAVSVVVFWPLWSQYFADYSGVSAWMTVATHGGFSAARDIRLFAVMAAAIGVLAIIDFRAAGWLSVPALWPASQFFYASFAMPLRSPWLMALLAVPVTEAGDKVPMIFLLYIAWRVIERLLAIRKKRSGAASEPAPAEGVGHGLPATD